MLQTGQQNGNPGLRIVLMEADLPGINGEMRQQLLSIARILSRNQINPAQDIHRPRREIAQIANGGGHQIQRPSGVLTETALDLDRVIVRHK